MQPRKSLYKVTNSFAAVTSGATTSCGVGLRRLPARKLRDSALDSDHASSRRGSGNTPVRPAGALWAAQPPRTRQQQTPYLLDAILISAAPPGGHKGTQECSRFVHTSRRLCTRNASIAEPRDEGASAPGPRQPRRAHWAAR